jgi:3-(3-hydroxy-phenyl)propionate hydroxylase
VIRALAEQTEPVADVAIVGLGPVGATLAALLAAQGVSVVVLERSTAPHSQPRAIALDDESQRILQAAGLDGSHAPPMLVGPGVRLVGRSGRTLLDLPHPRSVYGHPPLGFVHQPDLETALLGQLSGHACVEVRLGTEVTGLARDRRGVTLLTRIRTPTNTGTDTSASTGTVRARFVAGCDGAGSFVRRALGIRLRGWSSPQRWLVVDARYPDDESRLGPFTFYAIPARPRVGGPIPDGRHRWEFMLHPEESDAEVTRDVNVRELLAGAGADPQLALERAAIYRFHASMAAQWRVGRILLAGDAAHLSPPFAGQGLGAGLRDASNLAWKLAAVVRDGADEAVLDSYAAERRPHVRRMNVLALALGGVVQTRSASLARARDATLAGLLGVPAIANWARDGGWKPPPRHARGLVASRRGNPAGRLIGRLLPQPQVRDGTGVARPLDAVLGPGFALLGLDLDPTAALGGAARLNRGARAAIELFSARHLRILRAGATVIGPDSVVELDDALRDWWPLAERQLLVVRPDRHVFAIVPPPELGPALAALGAALALGSPVHMPV